MAEETEISTPEEITDDETTSSDEIGDDDEITSDDEVEDGDETAETETTEPKLYAGKYKTIEELEKGYAELNKVYTKNQQIQSKYDELVKQQEAQKAIQLEKAKQAGFNTVAEQEISDKATIEEFNAYANAMSSINPEYFETVRQNLLNYYNTANRAYLDEAKKYFPESIKENITLQKQNLINRLNTEYQTKAQQQKAEQEKALAETLKTEFADFLSDIQENKGKQGALKSFCDAGLINSKEDMQRFVDIYNNSFQSEREKAITEFQAQKAIEKTKERTVIDNGTVLDSNGKPDIDKMSQAEFDAYCDKHGTDWIWAKK